MDNYNNQKSITYEDFKKVLSALHEFDVIKRDIKDSRIEANLKYLQDKQEELGKPIPLELLAITYSGQPVGSVFLEKYKEWII